MASPPQSSPITLSIIIGTSIIAGVTGYFLGQASGVGILGKRHERREGKASGKAAPSSPKNLDMNDVSSEDEEEETPEGLKSFEQEGSECKLTLVVRMDLGMGKGKIAAQCSHATLACYRALQSSAEGQSILRRWSRFGQAKVALKVESEEDLELLLAQAMSMGVCAQIIHDAGRTQIASGSATVLGVGPAPKAIVDQITGHLKLL